LVPLFINNIKNNKPLPVYGDGKQIREWMYVYDNVNIIIDLMFDDEVINTVYNIGSGVHYTNIEVVDMISSIINKPVTFKYVPDRLGHDKKYSLSLLKLEHYYNQKDIKLNPLHLKDYLKNLYK
jgi:dTDP-glucose 4,6-dehydratase